MAATYFAEIILPPGSSHAIDLQVLSRLSMKELHDLRAVVHNLGDVVAAFLCQPRFQQGERSIYNEAGRVLDDIGDLFTAYENVIVRVAETARPTDPSAVDWRSWTILGFEADVADDLPKFAVLAATAVQEESDAEFRAREQGRASNG